MHARHTHAHAARTSLSPSRPDSGPQPLLRPPTTACCWGLGRQLLQLCHKPGGVPWCGGAAQHTPAGARASPARAWRRLKRPNLAVLAGRRLAHGRPALPPAPHDNSPAEHGSRRHPAPPSYAGRAGARLSFPTHRQAQLHTKSRSSAAAAVQWVGGQELARGARAGATQAAGRSRRPRLGPGGATTWGAPMPERAPQHAHAV